MSYIGDFALATTLYTKFTTVNASGVPTTLGNAPTFGFYQDANVTLFTAGVTVTIDFNSTTGLNHLQMIVTTSATGIVAGSAYQLVIATGSVSAVSMKGYVIGEFSVLRTTALRPTTAGATLDVSANGNAGIDWANIDTPGSTVNFSATTLFTATNVTNGVTVTAISTLVNANVTAITTIAPARITAQGIDVGAIVTGFNTIAPARVTAQGIDIGAIVTAFNTIAPANVTSSSTVLNANITAFSTIVAARITAQGIDIGAIVTAVSTIVPARITAQGIDVGAIVTGFNTIAPARVTSMAANTLTASALATDAVTEIAGGVWDELIAGHLGAGSTGLALNSASSAGDPWNTAVPGVYGAGTAGNILGNNLNATVTSRAAVTMLPTNFSATDISTLGIVGADTKLMATATVKGSGTTANLWRG